MLTGRGSTVTRGVDKPRSIFCGRLAGLGGWEGLLGGRANDYLPGLEMKGLTTLTGSLAPDTWLAVPGPDRMGG